MQNNFEKKVQEKLDELQFSPSAPVWTNVEKAIRRKKERRRMILWIPFLFLLLGGGIWWLGKGVNSGQQDLAVTKQRESIQSQQSPQYDGAPLTPVQQQESMAAEPAVDGENRINKEADNQNKQSEELSIQQKTTVPSKEAIDVKGTARKERNEKIKKQQASAYDAGIEVSSAAGLQKKAPVLSSNVSASVPISTGKTSPQNSNPSSPVKPVKEPEVTEKAKATATVEPSVNQTDSVAKIQADESKTPEAKPQPKDSVAAQPKPAEKKVQQGWKIALQVGAGTSGLARGLDFFGNKSVRENLASSPLQTPTTVGNPAADRGLSSIQNNWSLSFGVAAQRKLSSRLLLSAGLQYRYFSNSFATGVFIRQDTVVRSGAIVNGFYANGGTVFSNHTNHFHFIALPLSLRWQMLKKKPLNLEAGIALQQLLHTNYLIYDRGSNVYYSDNAQLNKLNVTAAIGADYRIIQARNFSLSAGPQLLYSFGSVDKTGNNFHLFSAGIGLRMQFEKN